MYGLGLGCLLDAAFKVGGEDVVQLFATLTGQWMLTVQQSLDSMDEDLVRTLFAVTCYQLKCYKARNSFTVVQIHRLPRDATPSGIPCRESGALF